MEKEPFKLIPKDKKLLKSSKVRKWLRECEKAIRKEMEANGTAWWEKPCK